MIGERSQGDARPWPHARAFTLLEVMLAAAIGTIVLIAALALMLSFQRTDARLARRYDDVAQLQHIRLVMERTCSTFLMAPGARGPTAAPTSTTEAKPADTTGAAAGTDGRVLTGADQLSTPVSRARSQTVTSRFTSGSKFSSDSSGSTGTSGGTPGTAGSGKGDTKSAADLAAAVDAAGTNTGRALRQPPPPRIELVAGDPLSEELRRAIVATGEGRPEGGRESSRSMLQPQRLEVVLSASPVPQTEQVRAMVRQRIRDNTTGSSKFDAPAEPGSAAVAAADQETVPVRAVRGAFEMHPQMKAAPDGSLMPVTTTKGSPLWEMWWVPLPPRPDPQSNTVDSNGNAIISTPPTPDEARAAREDAVASGAIGEPFKIAENLAYVEWKMFQERTRRTVFAAAMWSDLPAYVEMEVETAGGLTGNWLFEVSADQGPEMPPEEATGPTTGASGDSKFDGGSQSGSKAGGKSGSGTATPKTGGKGSDAPSRGFGKKDNR